MALNGKQLKVGTVTNAKLATASNTAGADVVVLSKPDAKIDLSFLPTDLKPWVATLTTEGPHTLLAGQINKYSRATGAMILHLPATPAQGTVVDLKETGLHTTAVTLTTASGTTQIENLHDPGSVTSVTLDVANLYASYKWDALNTTWRLVAVVNRSTVAAGQVEDDLDTLETSVDGDAVSLAGLSSEPHQFSVLMLYLNGVLINHVSYGNKTGSIYFSNDGGTTAAVRAALTTGTTLHWNGSVAGFELQSGWTVKVVYSV